MYSCKNQRQREYSKHLGIDAAPNLLFRHTNFLHNRKLLLILISLGNLFVIHHQRCGKDKDSTDHKGQKQNASRKTFQLCPFFSLSIITSLQISPLFRHLFGPMIKYFSDTYLTIRLFIQIPVIFCKKQHFIPAVPGLCIKAVPKCIPVRHHQCYRLHHHIRILIKQPESG